ncbi:MAG TPA: PAS domain-containing sensor histidine kinase, partial [Candidatus Nitrosocosmicus sp.]|nr:PAS domain-containing sensor histidine kinase [Candidatus Nitrosocosmicus sp.]
MVKKALNSQKVPDSMQTRAIKRYFPQANTKNIAEYLENLRWIEEMLFHWASLVESTDDAIYSKDLNGIITSWNPAAERMYGYSSRDIIGKSILTIFPDDRKKEFQYIINKIKKGKKIDHYETIRKKKDGKPVDVSVTVSPVKDITGRITGASVIARDITDKKKWQEDRYRLASIIESAEDAIIGKDLNGIITSWNPAAERIYGYSAKEIVGKSVSILVPSHKKDELLKIMNKIKKGEKIEHFETERIRKDGKIITVSLIISPIKDNSGTIIGASKIAHEITEQLELERQKELNKKKDDFISMASHELKTPLTILKAHIQVCLKENEKMQNAILIRSLPKAEAQINRLNKLINELLSLSRLQGGRYRYEKKQFNLDKLVEEVIEDYQGYSNTHQLILEGTIGGAI